MVVSIDRAAARPAPDPQRPAWWTRQEIVGAYARAYEAVLHAPCHLKPNDPRAAQEAEDMRSLPRTLPIQQAFERTIQELRASTKGFTISLKAVVNCTDTTPPKAARRDGPPPGSTDLAKLRSEMDAIAGEPTVDPAKVRALVKSVTGRLGGPK